jgi:hypothetical protein
MNNFSNLILRFNNDILQDIILDKVELNIQLSDIKNLAQSKSSFSVPFNIPYTPKAVSILGCLFNINNATTITHNHIDAQLIQNNHVIINGYVYVDHVDTNYIYAIIATGELTIFEDIQGLVLNNLNLTGTTYNNKNLIDYYSSNNSFTFSGDTGSTHHFVNVDWFGQAGNLNNYKGTNVNSLLSLRKPSPIIKVKTVFDAIMTANGYSYSGSSAFINKLNTKYMSTNVPITNYCASAETVIATNGNLISGYINAQSNHNLYLNPVETVNSKYFNIVSTHTNIAVNAFNHGLRAIYPFVDVGEPYTFNCRLYAHTSGASGNVKFYLHRAYYLDNYFDADFSNANEILIGEFTVPDVTNTLYYSTKIVIPDNTMISGEYTISGITDHWYGYYIRVEKDADIVLDNGSSNRITITNSWLYDTGHTYTLNDLLSNTYKQYDFLNDVLTDFNIYIYTDNQNKKFLNFKTYDDFKLNDVLDWSKKFSLEALEVYDLQQQLYQEYQLKNADGNDLINTSYKNSYNKSINQQDILNDVQINIKSINNIQLTIPENILTTNLVKSNSTNLPIASPYTAENGQIMFGFINYFNYGENILLTSYQLNSDLLNDIYGYMPILYNLNSYLTFSPFQITGSTINDISSPNTFALQFNTQDQYINKYSGNTITNNNLYSQFWQKELEEKIYGNQKYVRAKMKLLPEDLNIQNFRKRIWIDNSKLGAAYYRLLKITYPSDPTILSDVELISDVNYNSVIPTTIALNKLTYNPINQISNSSSNSSGSGGGGGGTGTQGSQGTGIQGAMGIQGATGTGIQGAMGIQGPYSQGPAGGTGPQGATTQGGTGPQGITGVATQGADGSQGGFGGNGPQGITGLQGIQATGNQGPTGPQGPTSQGANGLQGITGAGLQGITGAGIQGATGTGLQGIQGGNGTTGIQGPSAQGPTGLQGITGAGLQGITGAGIQGATGTQGSYGIQGGNGPTGPQGPTSQGANGLQGITGAGLQGIQGHTGTGTQGSYGIQGIQGPAFTQGGVGPQGATGAGTQGSYGIQGIQGIQGTTGTQGSDLRLKTNLQTISLAPLNIEYKNYEFKEWRGETRAGVIAQEIIDEYPEFVKMGEDGFYYVVYQDIFIREIASLKERVKELENK